MAKLFLPLVLGLAIASCAEASAKVTFNSSEVEGQGSEVIFCDLDGDRLLDAVLMDGLNLSVFYQDSQGFTRKPQLEYRLDDRPAVVWPARLGKVAESLLVMTSEGVTEFCFTNRTRPPTHQQIIQEATIIPDALDETPLRYFPLGVKTGTEWPLLLVPVAGGLKVFQHRDEWRSTQWLEHAVDAHLRAAVTNAGYDQSFGLNVSLGDVNRDAREDLMVMHDLAGGLQTYSLYLQQTNGLFGDEQVLTYTNKSDWHNAPCWIDLNRDGKLDLLQSTVLDDTSFIPGMRSGKVLVGVYLADAQGRIPSVPQQVFRKNDWAPTLPAVDVDGDGYLDLILGYIPINTREGGRKMMTAAQMDLNLKFFFNRPGAGFPTNPDSQRDVLIRFDREFFFSAEQRLYYERFLSFNGDFNGDGKKDLLVRDRRDGVSVYNFVSRAKGFNEEADLKFQCPEPIEWWKIEDLNGDGVSDFIVKLQKRNVFRIFTSEKK